MTTDGDTYVVGVDFGTLSGRALVVRVRDGCRAGIGGPGVSPRGCRHRASQHWEKLPPNWALQVPSDYVDVLRTAVPKR